MTGRATPDAGADAGADLGLAADRAAVVALGPEPHLLEGGRQHPPADLQHPRALAHREVEAPRDLGEGGEEQVAERVAGEIAVREPVLEQAAEEGLVVGQRDEAVADVAGR